MVIIVLSGPIAVGKSTLAKGLTKYGFHHISTRQCLINLCDSPEPTREELQVTGRKLDSQRPEWFVQLVAENRWVEPFIVVDSARKFSHIENLREHFNGEGATVIHVHLVADDQDLSDRYARRDESSAYESVKADVTERGVSDMWKNADVVINTSRGTSRDTLVRVLARVPVQSRRANVDVLVGGQYGSEGKGHVVAHIAPEYRMLIRVGGPNAGHSVLYKGSHVAFYHLPSGVLHAPNASLLLGAAMNIRIPVLMDEIAKAEKLGVDVRNRLLIDEKANVITDDDIQSESELVQGIGSTGQGVGYATAGKIMGRASGRKLARDYPELTPFICNAQDVLREAYESESHILLEGTQGTGLSLYHGPYPYVTSRDTTASGTLADAGIPAHRVRKVVMVVRTNPIRVQSPEGGTSGPMSKEIDWVTVSSRAGVPAEVLKEREKTTTTKRQRRVSEFDWSLLDHASQLNAPTDVALTFADYLSEKNKEARRFEQLTPETHELINEIELVSKAPVSLITTRLHERSIIDRRKGW